MKKILCLTLAFAMLLGALTALTSCGVPDDPGAKISVYLGDAVYDLDPTDYYVSDNAAQLMSLLYEPLFALDEDGDLVCAAAEDYDVDEDERKITIELKDSYWSDGARVKADDFVYAWRNAILDPTAANPAATLFYDIENAAEIKKGEKSIYELGVVANLYELIITYREGADYEQLLKNLASVATSPVREDVLNLAPAHWSKSSNSIVTNGPFKVKILDYDLGELTIERNVGYHQLVTTEDYDNEVTPYQFYTTFMFDDDEQVFSYKDIENKVIFYLSEATLEDRKANKNNAMTADLASTYAYVFDTTNPLFAKKEVRQALSLAVDRAAIINEITFGKAATGFLSSVSSSNIYDKKNVQALIEADAQMSKAKDLIKEVDFKGVKKSFTLTINDDAESVKIAELVKASWEELGFTVSLKKVDSTRSTIMDKATDSQVTIYDSTVQYYVNGAADGAKPKFDVIAVDWQTYSTDAFVGLCAFTSNLNGNGAIFKDNKTTYNENISGWTNADYDKLISDAYGAADENVRAEKLRQAEKLLVSEAPIIPIMFNVNYAFVSEELSDVEVDGFGNFILTEAELDNYHDYLPEEEDNNNEEPETEE